VSTASQPTPPEPVWLKVVRGHPTADELAALVTVITALAATRDTGVPDVGRSRWVGRSRERPRRLPSPGEGRWAEAYGP
jgi:Acyl-CoA carboxylase epsilon subunit